MLLSQSETSKKQNASPVSFKNSGIGFLTSLYFPEKPVSRRPPATIHSEMCFQPQRKKNYDFSSHLFAYHFDRGGRTVGHKRSTFRGLATPVLDSSEARDNE
ncbi:hypothetical protein TNCV_2255871 [Trichonephila clavipes]|nr:hypothetical protein TNCV_2255871 [Trichonephila clavipes]